MNNIHDLYENVNVCSIESIVLFKNKIGTRAQEMRAVFEIKNDVTVYIPDFNPCL